MPASCLIDYQQAHLTEYSPQLRRSSFVTGLLIAVACCQRMFCLSLWKGLCLNVSTQAAEIQVPTDNSKQLTWYEFSFVTLYGAVVSIGCLQYPHSKTSERSLLANSMLAVSCSARFKQLIMFSLIFDLVASFVSSCIAFTR